MKRNQYHQYVWDTTLTLKSVAPKSLDVILVFGLCSVFWWVVVIVHKIDIGLRLKMRQLAKNIIQDFVYYKENIKFEGQIKFNETKDILC